MTYLVTPSPSTQLPGTGSESLSNCATYPDNLSEILGCIHGADPEPIVWDTVTKLLSGFHDTLDECQDRVDDAMVRWSALRANERKKGLILQCRRVEIRE